MLCARAGHLRRCHRPASGLRRFPAVSSVILSRCFEKLGVVELPNEVDVDVLFSETLLGNREPKEASVHGVEKSDDVCILLNAPRSAQVTELRNREGLAFFAALVDLPVELRHRKDWHMEPLR